MIEHNSTQLAGINSVQSPWHVKLFRYLLLFLLIASTHHKVLASESVHPPKATIKAITLIEKSHTVIHAEFSIQMKPDQLSYRIDGLPMGIVSESISIHRYSD